MKTILVPTDFSESANNALAYAIELALKENAKIILLHSLELDYKTLLYTLVVPPSKTFKEEAARQMQLIEQGVLKTSKVKHESIIRDENLKEAIIDCIAEKKIDWVIMGTHGASGLKKLIVGSNTAEIMEIAACPVIAVPENAKFNGLHKITYTSNYHEGDDLILKKIVQLAKPLNAQINVLHVYTGHEQEEKNKMLDFIHKVNDHLHYNNISYQLLQGDDVSEKFDDYLESHATDMLSVSTQQRYLLDKLLNSSLAKELAYHSKVPIMVFHHAKQPILI